MELKCPFNSLLSYQMNELNNKDDLSMPYINSGYYMTKGLYEYSNTAMERLKVNPDLIC